MTFQKLIFLNGSMASMDTGKQFDALKNAFKESASNRIRKSPSVPVASGTVVSPHFSENPKYEICCDRFLFVSVYMENSKCTKGY